MSSEGVHTSATPLLLLMVFRTDSLGCEPLCSWRVLLWGEEGFSGHSPHPWMVGIRAGRDEPTPVVIFH